MIVSLGLHGTGAQLVIPASRGPFALGRDAVDLASPALVHTHATIERVDAGVRIVARGDSLLYPSARGAPVRELLLYAGALAWLDNVPLIPLDESMRALRPLLAQSMSIDNHAWVDNAIATIATRDPLLVVGPPGLGADAIIGALDGTVHRVNLDDRRTFTSRAAVDLFAPRRGERVVFRALSVKRARYVLDYYTDRTRAIALVPLVARRTEIPRLLDAMWREAGCNDGVHVLGVEALDGLQRYAWPLDLDELRAHAPRLLALHQYGGLRAAARHLGVKHQTLSQHLERIGVPVPDRTMH